MATTVNKDGIGEVYEGLEKKIASTLDTFLNKFTITEPRKAEVISNAVVALIQMSAQQVQQQPLIDVQVAQAIVQTNLFLKDIAVKDAQIAQATAQTNVIISDQSIKAAQSTKDLEVKEEQKVLIQKQQTTEEDKALLTVRQTTYYNDQCKIEKSKHYSTMLMGYAQSGTTVPVDLITATFTAANNII